MTTNETMPFGAPAKRVPVNALHVEIVDGPDAGKSVTASSDTLTIGAAKGNDLELSDDTVSRYHVELQRTEDGVAIIDHGSTNGTIAGAVRIAQATVPPGTVLRMGRSAVRVSDGGPVEVELHAEDRLGDLRGQSDAMRRLMTQTARAARTETSVLVVGESGTGKELIARALHDLGPRGSHAFVTVDCGAMAANLVASELFGHERGAFTGADRQHIGAFERANGGTLFLDEIGELPAELQPNLLGALERRRFRRVGGTKDIEVDVRVLAATNRDLRAEVNHGRFRLDLYYRLAVVTLRIAPLRERPDDIAVLVEHFLQECGYSGPSSDLFSADVLDELRDHHWPGNVRELRNLVEATVAMGETQLDEMRVGPPSSEEPNGPAIGLGHVLPMSYKEARAAVLGEFERQYLSFWLERSGGNVAKAARDAHMDRSHLFHLLRRHELR